MGMVNGMALMLANGNPDEAGSGLARRSGFLLWRISTPLSS